MGKSTISMAIFKSYSYVYQRVSNKLDLFEHVWHILLTAGWLWNPMISVILKVKLLWVCWSNPRKKRNPVTHSQKLLFCLLKPCLVKTVFFGEVPINVARSEGFILEQFFIPWWINHVFAEKMRVIDALTEFTIPSTNMLTLPWVFS